MCRLDASCRFWEDFEYCRKNNKSCLCRAAIMYNETQNKANWGRNPEYIHHAITFTTSVGLAAMILKLVPKFLKPYIPLSNGLTGRILAPLFVNIRRGERILEKYIGPIFQERLQKMQELGDKYSKQVWKGLNILILGWYDSMANRLGTEKGRSNETS